jgi:hypothetical protein
MVYGLLVVKEQAGLRGVKYLVYIYIYIYVYIGLLIF